MKVTEESMMLAITRCHTVFRAMPGVLRRKYAKGEIDDIYQVAAALYHVGDEIQTLTPIRSAVIERFLRGMGEWQ